MIKQNFIIDELEKKRILNLHESRTKNHYLIKEENGQTKEEYPPCVQSFGEPIAHDNGTYYIKGTGNWVGYSFNKEQYYDPNTGKSDKYYCRANEIIFGERKVVTTGSKPGVTNADTEWSVIENGEKLMKIGSSGPLVKKVQAWLQTNNFGKFDDAKLEKIGGPGCSETDNSKCDGRFGNTTKEAVIEYQKLKNLNPDGIVGRQFVQTMYATAGAPVVKPKVEPEVDKEETKIEKYKEDNPGRETGAKY